MEEFQIYNRSYQIDHYHIEEKIGEGKTAILYLATEEFSGGKRVLKFYDPEINSRKAVVRYCTKYEQLKLVPGIVRYYHTVKLESDRDPVYFSVMEYVDGKSPQKYSKKGSLPLLDSLKLVLDLTMTIELCHARGVYVGDLHSENLLITSDRKIKVVDLYHKSKLSEKNRDDDILKVCELFNELTKKTLLPKKVREAFAVLSTPVKKRYQSISSMRDCIEEMLLNHST